MTRLKGQFLERHPEAREQDPKPGPARVISHQLYQGETFTFIQQGQGWSLLRGATPQQLHHELDGRGAQAKLISQAQPATLEQGALVRLDANLKTLWTHEQRSREQEQELKRELRNRQPKRDRGPDR